MEIHKKSCSVFGHRSVQLTADLTRAISNKFTELLDDGYRDFYFGEYGEFDDHCHTILTELMANYSGVSRIRCIADSRPKYLTAHPLYEKVVSVVPDFNWWYKRLYFRNCKIIDMSDFVIFFVNHTEQSGAYKAMQYAASKKKPFFNIGTVIIK